MMRLTRFTIERYRQFEKPVEIALAPLTVLIGANNSGKTAVLQAFALFQYCLERCVIRNGKSGSESNWGLKKTENISPDSFGPLPVAATAELWPQGRVAKAIRLKGDFEGSGSITFEIKLQHNLFNIKPIVEGVLDLNQLLTSFMIRMIPVFSGLVPKEEFLVLPARQERQQAQRHGEIVRNLLYSLKHDSPSRYELLTTLLHRLYPAASIDVDYDEEKAKRIGSARIESSYHDQILREDLDLIVAGSGLHQAVQILAGMLQPGITLALLDEPDSHFHARLQGELMRIFIDLSEAGGMQFLIATHSPQLLRVAPPSSLRVCRNSKVITFDPGPEQFELLDQLGVLERMELVPLLQSRRVVFVENREDRQLIELFVRKHLGENAGPVLQRITFLYTYQEPIASGVLQKARQVSDILRDDTLGSLGGSGEVTFLSVGDRDYRTESEMRTEERTLVKKAKTAGFGFPFRLLLWRRTEIENYLLDIDAFCRAAQQEATQRGKSAAWPKMESDFRKHFAEIVQNQREVVTDRFAARLQDRDRRQNLTAVMDSARKLLETEWGDGIAWCDAKKVISGCRSYLQEHGIAAQALSHKAIIDAMATMPDDVIRLVTAITKIAYPFSPRHRKRK